MSGARAFLKSLRAMFFNFFYELFVFLAKVLLKLHITLVLFHFQVHIFCFTKEF